ncbi:cellulose synthase/poly-beta-1,6-N-acetylglucosamine synthase-like glycosyltransferase [Lutibacter sp. Hel_I_33_5]|uniref:glycosyltransferase n=1 Tax=Lutibacter sp. Hel_I_33_5 TaxID=1566289 RepID=UPI0011AD43F8|nr:glycosyltransferase [Lutibacter sp. Hel_I_33_5]TVZ55335.1 cellulose synthase/poly-beta-1,6-N-acetylglucosamine synthase-like glycosyltransferase [Lutibacter sp. Hel_I_33_5]
MIITVFFYFFVAVTAIQIIYYLSFLSFLSAKKKKSNNIKNLPISVIICAKNEAQNLQKYLPSVINQKYNDFEIVLINDASSDDTLEVMENFEKKNNNIKIVDVKNIEAFWGNKKYALTLGIKAAKNEHLLFTDADCLISSDNWISEMSTRFNEEKTIILGYGKYAKTKRSLVNLLVRYETLLTAIQYFSYAKLGSPYMGVGRNLAYTKSDFFKTKGFISHLHIRSGDDDLFIQDAASNTNTTICTSLDSFTVSDAPTSLQEWFRQKRRHISTSDYYKFKHKFFLGLFYTSKVFFYMLSIIFLIYNWKISLPLIILYYLICYISVGLSAKKLQETQVLFFLPFLEIFLLLFQFTIFIANSISKPVHWK